MKLKIIQKPKIDKIEPVISKYVQSKFIGGMLRCGENLITSSEDGSLRVTNISNLSNSKIILDIGNNGINHIVFSQKHKMIIAAGDDMKIYFIDSESHTIQHEIIAHDSYVTKLALHEDFLFSISKDKTIKIWNLNTYELITTLNGHQEWVYSLAVSPDGKRLVSGSNNCGVKVWNLETYEEITELVKGSYILYSGNNLSIGGHNDSGVGNKDFPKCAIWPNNECFYTLGSDIVCWNASDYSVKWHKDFSIESFNAIVFVPQFNILIGVSDQIYASNPLTGETVFVQKNISNAPFFSCCVFGDELFTGDEKGIVSKWNLNVFMKKGSKTSFSGDIYKPVFLPEIQRIIGGSWLGGQISIWSKNGDFITSLKGLPSGSDQKIIAILPLEPHKVITTGKGVIWIVDVLKGIIDKKITLDNPNISVTEAIFLNDTEVILSCTITQPRLLNILTEEIKIIASDYALSSENFRLNENLILFQLSYFIEKNYYESEAQLSEISLKIKEVDLEIKQKQAPLVIYDIQKNEIVQELWYQGKVKRDSGHYGWPIVGGPENQVMAICYTEEKEIYLWNIGEKEPFEIKKLKKDAESQYSKPYPVFATTDYFIFRMDDNMHKFNIAEKKWVKFNTNGWKNSFSPDKKCMAYISRSTTLVILNIETLKEELFMEVKFEMEWVLWVENYIYIHNASRGIVVYEILNDK